MTLDEAIRHAEEVADEKERETQKLKNSKLDWKHHEANLCSECAKEHRQLAEWLKDYKRLKKQKPILDKIIGIIEPLKYLALDEMSNEEWLILEVINKYKAEKNGEVI